MDPSRLSLFAMAEKRLAWASARQGVLAQNIANANTPGWMPRDVQPFAALLAGRGGVAPAVTDSRHLSGRTGTAAVVQAATGERAPDGNGVALDVELTRVADTESTHAFVTSLYTKYLGMFRTAAGRS